MPEHGIMWAYARINEGKTVRSKSQRIYLKGDFYGGCDFVNIRCRDSARGEWYDWQANWADVTAKDWEVVK